MRGLLIAALLYSLGCVSRPGATVTAQRESAKAEEEIAEKPCTRESMITNLKRRGCWRIEDEYQPGTRKEDRPYRKYDACKDEMVVIPRNVKDEGYEYWDCKDVTMYIQVPLRETKP